MKDLAEEDIENREGIDGSYPAERILSEIGLRQLWKSNWNTKPSLK